MIYLSRDMDEEKRKMLHETHASLADREHLVRHGCGARTIPTIEEQGESKLTPLILRSIGWKRVSPNAFSAGKVKYDMPIHADEKQIAT